MRITLSMPMQMPRFLGTSKGLTNKDFTIKPKELKMPYVIKNALIIDEGTHNGDYYSADELKKIVDQYEGLPLFKDHHKNPMGGTVESYAGEILNPKWNSKHKAIFGDLKIIDDNVAKHLHYGAKIGLSVTVDADIRADHQSGRNWAVDPITRSCSFVLDPAVRKTMLNSNKEVENFMEVDNENPPVDGAVMKKLEAIEKRLSKIELKKDEEKEEYPYPKKKDTSGMSTEDLERELAKRKKKDEDEEEKMESEKVAELKAKLEKYEAKELEQKIDSILGKEVDIGLLSSKDSEEGKAKAEELKKMSSDSLNAVEGNLDRILKKMEALDSEPATAAESQPEKLESVSGTKQRRDYSKIDLDQARIDANKALKSMMLRAQGGA